MRVNDHAKSTYTNTTCKCFFQFYICGQYKQSLSATGLRQSIWCTEEADAHRFLNLNMVEFAFSQKKVRPLYPNPSLQDGTT